MRYTTRDTELWKLFDTKKLLDCLATLEIDFIKKRMCEPFFLYKNIFTNEELATFEILSDKGLIIEHKDYYTFSDDTLNHFKGTFDDKTGIDMKDKYIEYLLDVIKKQNELLELKEV